MQYKLECSLIWIRILTLVLTSSTDKWLLQLNESIWAKPPRISLLSPNLITCTRELLPIDYIDRLRLGLSTHSPIDPNLSLIPTNVVRLRNAWGTSPRKETSRFARIWLGLARAKNVSGCNCKKWRTTKYCIYVYWALGKNPSISGRRLPLSLMEQY